MNNQKYLRVAIQAAKQAAPIFFKYFGRAGKTKIKNGNPQDLVTKIDLKIEKLIRQIINRNFPGSQIIGEEFGGPQIEPSDVVWLIDPIDGTTNYIQGIPITCVSIGVWDKHGPLLGVVFNPILNQMYTALRGQGARLNNKIIGVSKVKKLSSAIGGIGWLTPKKGIQIFNNTINDCRKLRILASSAWQTCMVASGHLDFYATADVNIWDVGAATIILREAGGKYSDFQNKNLKLNLKKIIASNGKIHKALLKTIK